MNLYKQKLEKAEDLIRSDPRGEAGTRFLWSLSQLTHSYVNLDVENLRVIFPKTDNWEIEFRDGNTKDVAYVLGHITCWFILPTILFHFIAKYKLKKED
jgi:hypothetical protein